MRKYKVIFESREEKQAYLRRMRYDLESYPLFKHLIKITHGNSLTIYVFVLRHDYVLLNWIKSSKIGETTQVSVNNRKYGI